MDRLKPVLTACSLIVLMLIFFQSRPVASDEVISEAEATSAGSADLRVYKKWIGASGIEANVEINLYCRESDTFEPRFINHDRADGWSIEKIPADGIFCSVREVVRATFIADYRDCLDLLVVPDQDVDCTIVNTKVVKRIDMLNRYGLIMMIAVMLGAGLAAVKKFAPM